MFSAMRRSCQHGYHFNVPKLRRTQNQPLRLEDGGYTSPRNDPDGISGSVSDTGSLVEHLVEKPDPEKSKGEAVSASLFKGPVEPRRFGQTPADPTMVPPFYSAAASIAGRTEMNTRPLALVLNVTRPSVGANSV